MRAREVGFLLMLGCLFWVAGTLWFAKRGAIVLESTAARYWMNFAMLPIISTLLCLLVLRLTRIPAHQWASATLLIALPGMVGESILLSHFGALMPRMHEASAGKYGAFLFATYALALGLAEAIWLRAG